MLPSRIDLIVPYVGDPDRVMLTVRSVLAQDDPAWSLHVVEDGDQGQDVAGRLAALGPDPRVHHHLNATNLGVGGNFQRCLEVATAEWVTFPGCDDLLDPGYVAGVRSAASLHPGASAVHPSVTVIDADGCPSLPVTDRVKSWLRPRAGGQAVVVEGDTALTTLLHGNWAYFPAICWRRDVIAPIGFRQDLPTTLDLALLAQVLLDGGSLVVSPAPGLRYRRHDASASSTAARQTGRFVEEARLFDEIRGRCLAQGWQRSARAARLHVTSRAHAALLLADAIAHRDRIDTRALASHVLRS